MKWVGYLNKTLDLWAKVDGDKNVVPSRFCMGRFAKNRDVLKWVGYLNKTLDLWAKVDGDKNVVPHFLTFITPYDMSFPVVLSK